MRLKAVWTLSNKHNQETDGLSSRQLLLQDYYSVNTRTSPTLVCLIKCFKGYNICNIKFIGCNAYNITSTRWIKCLQRLHDHPPRTRII